VKSNPRAFFGADPPLDGSAARRNRTVIFKRRARGAGTVLPRAAPVWFAFPMLTLASFNAAPADAAIAAMLACCASRRFATAMADGRPYASAAAAVAAVDAVFESLTWSDVLEAMDAHPRIGARVSGRSATEQSGVADAARGALAAANAAYEDRFGHVFLICATGLTGDQMLAALRERLKNSEEMERAVASAELRKITRLRVAKELSS
jgi:2-oxo-4-hydroxy-4-carboxy-5-ureidoimidazoline decarboxylase